MTFSISKKDLVLYSTIVILVVTLAASFLVYKVQAQEEKDNSKIQFETDVPLGEENNKLAELNQGLPSGSTIEHLSCSTKLDFGDLPTSENYNPNTPYNLSSFSNGIHFQDVNGDNLPDYLYVNQNNVGIGDVLKSTYKGCVMLNSGNGWTMTHICRAETDQNLVTGEFTAHEYRGDCAETSNASGNSKE